jgi:hypothetical protein
MVKGVCVLWLVVDGVWCAVYGVWCVVYGLLVGCTRLLKTRCGGMHQGEEGEMGGGRKVEEEVEGGGGVYVHTPSSPATM